MKNIFENQGSQSFIDCSYLVLYKIEWKQKIMELWDQSVNDALS